MATKKTFDFKLGDQIYMANSNEMGEVIGRAQYIDSNPQYLVRYVANDGRLTECWWAESAIKPATPERRAALEEARNT